MYTGYDIQNENRPYLKAMHTEFMAACAGFDGVESIDPRPWYKIEMQYQMGSCVGNALTGPFEFSYRAKTGQIAQFSRMYAYLMSQKYSDMVQPGGHYFGRDGGALIGGARKLGVEGGLCYESTFPYPNGYNTKIPAGATEEAAKFKMGSSSVIGTTQDPFAEAISYMRSGLGGLIVGAPWPFNISNNHTVTSFRNYGGYGHAWTILGFERDILIAANSHDVTFEDKGWFYLNRQGFNEMVANSNTSVVGLSDLTVPRGRLVDWTKESMFS